MLIGENSMNINPSLRTLSSAQSATISHSQARRLTDSDQEPLSPRVSPVGDTVVYAAGTSQPLIRELYTVSADGVEHKMLTDRQVNLSWQPALSPSGEKIAYVVEKQGKSDLQVMNLDGSANKNLTNTNKGYWNPAWSPDGQTIVTTSRDTERGNLELVAIAADGSGTKQLTRLGYNTENPVYTRDGEHIVFGVSPGYGNPVLSSINSDGTDFRAYATDLVLIGAPAVSKDNEIVFSATKGDGKFGIYNVRLDSDAPATLLIDTDFGLSPTFSPDGEHIAFVDSDEQGKFQIYEADADGTDVRALTTEGSNTSPAYTSDGNSLVFLSTRDGRKEVYRQEIRGQDG